METTTTATSRKTLTDKQLAEALGCTEAQARSRVCALGYVKECGRCGGTGEYSFNQIDGTRCFGCRGAKKVRVAITPKMLDEIRAKIAAGALDAYFARAQAVAEAKKATRLLKATIDAEWKDGAIHALYRTRSHMDPQDELHRTVTSQLFNGVGLVNAAWDRANRVERRAVAGSMSAARAAAEMEHLLAVIREANGYCAAHAAEMLEPAEFISKVRGHNFA